MSNDIKINKNYIKQFNPCQQGIDNFNHHYPNWSGSLADLLGLENINYADKMWLVRKMIKNKLIWEIFAIDCAFAAQEYATKAATTTTASDAAYAANASAAADAPNAPNVAAYATAAYYATYAADAAADAPNAAAYATAAYYATYAADAAADAIAAYYAANAAAKSAREIEQERQLSALVYLIENESEINNEEGEE